MRKVCVECGKSVGKTDKFCRHCRAEIPDGSTKPSADDLAVLDDAAIKSLDLCESPEIESETDALPVPETSPTKVEPEDTPPTEAEDAPAKSLFEPVPKLTLVVVEGDQRGARFDCLEGQPLWIGGSARADIRLSGDEYASGIHAKVTAETNGLLVNDENSTNGTYLKLVGPQRLLPGELVLFGRTLMRVEKG